MGQYVIRRLLIIFPMLILITLVNFTMQNLAPGDPLDYLVPVTMRAEMQMNEQDIAILRARYGLDKPIFVRYVLWLKEIVQGNFGYSIIEKRDVSDMLAERLPNTLELAILSMFLANLWATIAGVIAALKQYSVVDYTLTVISFTLSGIPQFFVGLVFILIFAVQLHWLPLAGIRTANVPFDLWDHTKHLIMPVVVLSLPAASVLRQARSAMLEELNKDYAVVARSKGLAERTINTRHVFRNALLPLITLYGLQLPQLLGGSVIVETIFEWPGMGKLGVDSAVMKDYSTLMAITSITAVMVLLANLITDISYAWVDPRIRYN
ncbi:MAG: ABC transporter permease [Chloroflexi bacterium]|nr:ABC transporter permease [Chloroflexota bacterium]